MKTPTIALALLLLLSGCIPLRQQEISGTHSGEYLLVSGNYIMEQFGPSNKIKEKEIIADESFVISPKNERYEVELEPHDYDIARNSPYIRDRIYLLNDHGDRIRSIGNGEWLIYLMLSSKDSKELRDFKAKIWTFYYNPIVDGPPN